MKQKFFLFVILLAIVTMKGYTQPIGAGDKLINVGLGIGSTLYSGTYYKGQIPPISGSFEYVVSDGLFDGNAALGIGGYLGLSSYKYENMGWGWKYTSVVVGPRGYVHYNFLDNLDTYTGLLLGYNVLSSKEIGTVAHGWSGDSSAFAWSWFVGGRYFFSDNLAAMVELGYGVSYLNIGVTFTLP